MMNLTDQAGGLRKMASIKPVKVLAISAGKGGVGKTNIAVNLSIALAKKGKQVLLFDADLGLSNVDILLGISPTLNLSQVIQGQCDIEEVIVNGPAGLRIIPASSGIQQMSELDPLQITGLIRSFSEIGEGIDYLVVDTAAGISSNVINYLLAAQDILLVVCDEPTSLTDTYAMIKLLSRDYGIKNFNIVVNMVKDAKQAKMVYTKLFGAVEKFLSVCLQYSGFVPQDDYVRFAVKEQRAFIEQYPKSRAALSIQQLAQKVLSWPMPEVATGRLEFFVERLIYQTSV